MDDTDLVTRFIMGIIGLTVWVIGVINLLILQILHDLGIL